MKLRYRCTAALLAVSLSFAESASGQTCCTTTGANDLGVVDRDHVAVLGAELNYDRAYGSFDGDGSFRTLRNAEVDDLMLSLAGGLRLWPRALQLHGGVALRFQYRQFGSLQGSHLGLGDSAVSLRYLLLDAGREGAPDGRYVPFVEPFVGLRIPSGTGPEEADSATLVDATGDGATMAHAGVLLAEHVSESDAVELSVSYGHRFAREVEYGEARRSFAPGPELNARASFGHSVDMFWSWKLFLSLRATGSSDLDGRTLADSATHRLRAGAMLAHFLRFPTWQLVASASFDPPIGGFGSNVPFAGSSLILSVRRSFVQ